MAEERSTSAWRALGTRVYNSWHTAPPTHSALRWLPEPDADLPLVLAMSTSHGIPTSCRGDVGVQLAVDTAVRVLQDFAQRAATGYLPPLSAEQLLERLVQGWHEAAAAALTHTPLSWTELVALESQHGRAVRETVEGNPSLAYDATVLAVAILPTTTVYVQLGEGDISLISETGQVTRWAPGNQWFLTPERSSLGAPNARQDIHVQVQTLPEPLPVLITLCSEHYPSTFRTDENMYDLLTLLRTDGPDRVQTRLETWLTETWPSERSSDLALGLLYRLEARPLSAAPTWPTQAQATEMDAAAAFYADESPLSESDDMATADFDQEDMTPPASDLQNQWPETPDEESASFEDSPRYQDSRTGVVLVRCRHAKKNFWLRLEERGYDRWIVSGTSPISGNTGNYNGGYQSTISGNLGFTDAYAGCPHCQAKQVFQCGCGRIACWDGARHAVTCPWCSAIAERGREIENLRLGEGP